MAPMRFRHALPLVVLLALAVAAPANAAYKVGLSEQSAGVFADSNWQNLKLKKIRYIVPWDVLKYSDQAGVAADYLTKARAANQEVLLSFTAHQGCYNNGRYSRSSVCRAPSVSAYKAQFRAFKAKYPWIRHYVVWNEVNHVSQPTDRNPRLAARYYNSVRSSCRGSCKLMAADLLDESTLGTYLRDFRRSVSGSPRLWGLHNYKDVNRRQDKGLRTMLDAVPGEVWLTETGGIVKLEPSFPFSPSRAASRTRYLFQQADKYDRVRAGLRGKLGRVYNYRWYGEPADSRFDAGLVAQDGTPRAALATFARYARTHR